MAISGKKEDSGSSNPDTGKGDTKGSCQGASLLVWLKRLMVAAAVALGVGYMPFEIYGEKGIKQYLKLKQELHLIRDRNGKLKVRVSRIRSEIEALREDRETLERVARDELGLIKEGELVFVVRKQRWP